MMSEEKREMGDKTDYIRDRVMSGHAPHKLVKTERRQYTDKRKDEQMAIQILIRAPARNLSTKWEYEVQYFKEHGNTKNDIWNRDAGFIQQTSLYQLYLKAALEAMIYLNTLDKDRKPDTHRVTIYLPCEICIGWLQDTKHRMLSSRDRAKTKRGYRQFVTAINVETKEWSVEYKLSKENEE